MSNERHIVTGADGYAGKYIAQQLLQAGHEVRTLTNSRPAGDPFDGQVAAFPLAFDNPEQLVESLRGANVLYNTYWVRFNHRRFSHAAAVQNTKRLFDAAKAAGVERIVHVSITNPAVDSPFEYFRGKGELEHYLKGCGISYAILRPAVFFGREDILINNIAWVLRRFPVYGLFGDGSYGIQPIHVEDFARLALAVGAQSDNITLDAIGPESFTFKELVETLGRLIRCPRPIIRISPWLGLLAGKVVGLLVRDVVITGEEIGGLMAGLLAVNSEPLGKTRLTEWVEQHSDCLGRHYASELARRKVD
ncbi:MAG: NAD(P)H-binding protein [Desulfuromonadaceae bacterium]